MSKIIVPIDGSQHAIRALEYALDLARAFGDELILLNVQLNLNTINVKRFFSKQEIEEFQQQLGEEDLEEAIKVATGSELPFTSKIRIGIPKVEICQEAEQEQVRCIVMGSRGMGPVVGRFLGSVSYGVVHESPCPVTIVP
ncbi:universal stress protein UspA [Ammoniphilus oxalaticus]|uniref:Universal stress protein UspA n=1 Tax=Ammoniphilus oxalaticus TaxID=66863 RepID=A0A419SNK8_9BACL|nr:universal stress protein [Ammoniphilus oxalaticus]RKD25865.1 universal stress protein UspA [Ammoniphilus oxalaticus]